MRERVKHLSTGVAIYGGGEALTTLVNFGLLFVYVKGGYLVAADYGALALIQSLEAYAKIVSRWGLDGAFMRFYHDSAPGLPRQRMTSTIVWFMVAVNGVLAAGALGGSAWLARAIELDASHVHALQLMLVNMFFISFTFVPFHSMRLENEATAYSAFMLARSVGQIVLRVVFVIGLGYGVMGMYLSDLILTAVLLPLMWPWFRPVLAWRFSSAELRRSLRFGLPRLPHGLASQTLDGNPKLMLGSQVSQAELGVYQNGVTLGTGVAFFKNALETAFAPFYYATAREPDAPIVFAKLTTYGIAVFALVVAGTVAVAADAIVLLLKPEYLAALPVVPIVAVAFALQGVYQLTSIGLNLTSRTEFYSVSTITAAIVSITIGAWLIPKYHVTGAAVTVLVSYATQFAVATWLSQKVYPVRYETTRILRVLAAAALAALVARFAVPAMPALAGLLVRGTVTVGVYGLLLLLTGFFRQSEVAFARELIARRGRGRRKGAGLTDGR